MRLPLLHVAPFSVLLIAYAHASQSTEPAKEAKGLWLSGTIYAGEMPLKEAEVKKLNATDEGAKQLNESGAVTLKGLAIRLDNCHAGPALCFDTELLRISAVWKGGYVTPIKLMSRGEFPTALGETMFFTPSLPGWSKDGSFDDPRPNQLGPLPADWGKWRGFYVIGDKVILSYSVGNVGILDLPEFDSGRGVFVRTLRIEKNSVPLELALCKYSNVSGVLKRNVEKGEQTDLFPAPYPDRGDVAQVVVLTPDDGAKLAPHGADLYTLSIPPSDKTRQYRIAMTPSKSVANANYFTSAAAKVKDLEELTHGGRPHWPEVQTQGKRAVDDAPYVVDTLTLPKANLLEHEMQLAGLDFFSDGRLAVSTFSGDVWIVSGIDDKLEHLKWRRYAAGLYHALGLKIVNDEIYVLGRDQVTRLHDLNNDGEADFYENFNNDVHITSNFHEFAFDLQTDPEGNFYFSKAGPVRNGGRGFQNIIDHHGSFFKLTPDGSKLSVLATGFRAPNGIGVGPHGELSSGDNEGTWMPMCRLNAIKPGGFYGVPPTSHRDPPPSTYDKPICWFPKEVDNSSGGQVWDTTGGKFGPFAGEMLHLSYGTCSLFHVLKEEIDGVPQGGVVRFPLQFNSGIMRARFNPKDNALYLCGLRGWQTSAAQAGGLQRVRFTGKPVHMPLSMHVQQNGIRITFTDSLDDTSAKDIENYDIQQWNYVWSEAYGSPHVSAKRPMSVKGDDKNEWSKAQMSKNEADIVKLKAVSISEDKKTIVLEIPELQPVMQMRIRYNLKAADGSSMKQEIVSTINVLGAI